MYAGVPSMAPASVRDGRWFVAASMNSLRHSEIENLDVPFWCQRDVAGLQVPVDDPLLVGRVESVGDLPPDRQNR